MVAGMFLTCTCHPQIHDDSVMSRWWRGEYKSTPPPNTTSVFHQENHMPEFRIRLYLLGIDWLRNGNDDNKEEARLLLQFLIDNEPSTDKKLIDIATALIGKDANTHV